MAPLASPDGSQPRFANGLCSTSMAPSPPSSGFPLDNRPHLQRLLQSSASPNEDSSFHIHQQARQFYLHQRQEHPMLPNGGAVELQRASSNAETLVGTELPKDSTQLGQALQSYVQRGGSAAAIFPSLMRYHSAPSSVLSSLTGMGNAVMNHSSELGHFLSGNAVSEAKDGFKPMEASHAGPLHIESQGKAAAASADRLPNHSNGLAPLHAPYQRVCGGELISQMSMDTDDVSLMRTPSSLSELGKAALESPSSYCQRSPFLHSSTYIENGNGTAHGMPIAKDGLLRHSSSPAGFLSQYNEDQERHGLPSSSGNSSEEGSYERHRGQGILGSFGWDESGNLMIGGSSNLSLAARKRIRELGDKGYSGSTGLDSQKVESTLEHSVMGNYFGLSTAGSPENAYFAEKVSPDSIPCRTRAKRGCATHPRSIAERVRRTKISERMKKLQELVPNMDKQANTAEMLDEAVEYVKFLQRQVQELTENQSKCKCLRGKSEETPSLK